MNETKKIQAFEYIVIQLAKWFVGKQDLSESLSDNEIKLFNKNNDFDTLKVLKLLFFVCAVGDIKEKTDLLSTFKFVAMPFGPVELDIYEAIKGKKIENIEITITNSAIKDGNILKNNTDTLFSSINIAIDSLRKLSKDIVKYRQWQLVDISHLWNCWSFAINIARSNNKKQHPMDSDLILQDTNCPLSIT